MLRSANNAFSTKATLAFGKEGMFSAASGGNQNTGASSLERGGSVLNAARHLESCGVAIGNAAQYAEGPWGERAHQKALSPKASAFTLELWQPFCVLEGNEHGVGDRGLPKSLKASSDRYSESSKERRKNRKIYVSRLHCFFGLLVCCALGPFWHPSAGEVRA